MCRRPVITSLLLLIGINFVVYAQPAYAWSFFPSFTRTTPRHFKSHKLTLINATSSPLSIRANTDNPKLAFYPDPSSTASSPITAPILAANNFKLDSHSELTIMLDSKDELDQPNSEDFAATLTSHVGNIDFLLLFLTNNTSYSPCTKHKVYRNFYCTIQKDPVNNSSTVTILPKPQ